ncbi:MAG: DUF2157 domain-containing protein [Actinomycetales bacterium]
MTVSSAPPSGPAVPPDPLPLTPVSARRFAWLDEQVSAWRADGVLTSAQAGAILARYRPTRRIAVITLMLCLGAAFVGVGVIWLVAANLDQLSPVVRFTLLALLWTAVVALAEWTATRSGTSGVTAALAGTLRGLAAVLWGAVIFQAAQGLQVPAYSAALLGWWALGAVGYAYLTRAVPPLVVGLGVGLVWVSTDIADQAGTSLDVIVGLTVVGVFAITAGAVHGALAGWGPLASFRTQERRATEEPARESSEHPAVHAAAERGSQPRRHESEDAQLSSPGSPATTRNSARWAAAGLAAWQEFGAAMLLVAGFIAALPLGESVDVTGAFTGAALSVRILGVATALLVVVALLRARGARWLETTAVGLVAGLGVVAMACWPSPADILSATGIDWLRAILAMLGYLALSGWVAVLGVLRESWRFTVMAMASLVIFTTVQAFAVIAPIIDGAWLFLAVGLVLMVAGLLADRGRRHLAVHVAGAR